MLVSLVAGSAGWTGGLSIAHAGAFLQEEGHGQILAIGTFTPSATYFDGRGALFHGGAYRKAELPVVVEYGLRDDVTLLFGASLLSVSAGAAPSFDYHGLGGATFGARMKLFAAPEMVVSFQAVAKVADVVDDGSPATVGQTDNQFDLRLLMARSFQLAGYPAFVDVQAGYRYRAGAPPSEWVLDLTFGIRPQPRWLVLVQNFNVASDGRGGPGFPATRYSKAQASIVYEFAEGWSVQAGLLTTFAGLNAWREQGAVLGVWRRF